MSKAGTAGKGAYNASALKTAIKSSGSAQMPKGGMASNITPQGKSQTNKPLSGNTSDRKLFSTMTPNLKNSHND